jgi:mono/diheme cytochrome c family protein
MFPRLIPLLILALCLPALAAAAEKKTWDQVWKPINSAAWSRGTVEDVWKRWGGHAERPGDFWELFRARYGLWEAPYENNGLPMGLHKAAGIIRSNGVATDCMMCHSGRVAGRTIVGLGNASLDLQGLMEELYGSTDSPIQFSNVRGTTEAAPAAAFLIQFRDDEMNLVPPVKLSFRDDLIEDAPAWWLLKRKATRGYSGSFNARSVRLNMAFAMSPLNGGTYFKKQEPVFEGIVEFILGVEAPKYPFEIDQGLVAKGKPLFEDTCARCHGTYGEGGKYPNKVVDADDIGTDRLHLLGFGPQVLRHVKNNWMFRGEGPAGGPPEEPTGYQAPPLDGVWATAPYFHNGSVPTLYHVLNSKARPTYFTRSYLGREEDYDRENVGHRVTVLERPPFRNLPGIEQRKVYDTTKVGRGNMGHRYGDKFSDEQRRAVIEYLKTL